MGEGGELMGCLGEQTKTAWDVWGCQHVASAVLTALVPVETCVFRLLLRDRGAPQRPSHPRPVVCTHPLPCRATAPWSRPVWTTLRTWG